MGVTKPRMDVPFERLHQNVIQACLSYEQAMARKKKRVDKIVITYNPRGEPSYDVQIEEVSLERAPRRIETLAANAPPSGVLPHQEEEEPDEDEDKL